MKIDCDSLNAVLDTLNFANDSLVMVIQDLKPNSDINKTNLFRTFLSSGTIILIFLAERIFTFFSNRKMKRIEFFQEIVVKPSISRIINFFSDFYVKLKESISELQQAQGSRDEYLRLVQSKLLSLKQDKIKFDHEFLSLVRSVNNSKANELTDALNKLDDIATECFTNNESLSNIDLSDLEKDIHAAKAIFFEKLHNKI